MTYLSLSAPCYSSEYCGACKLHTPLWFYCRQTSPVTWVSCRPHCNDLFLTVSGSHCKTGMVFAVNPTAKKTTYLHTRVAFFHFQRAKQKYVVLISSASDFILTFIIISSFKQLVQTITSDIIGDWCNLENERSGVSGFKKMNKTINTRNRGYWCALVWGCEVVWLTALGQ